MTGHALGPTLGGYLTDTLGWRWIFFINIPFGILAVIAAILFFVPDTINKQMNRTVGWWGIGLLALGLLFLLGKGGSGKLPVDTH